MKPTLENKPEESQYTELRAKYAEGKPLTADQLNFLINHEKMLSNPHMDAVSKYYLKHMHHDYLEDHSFLLPSEKMNKEAIQKFKRRLRLLLEQNKKNITLKFTPEQFIELQKLTYGELILYHGNQLVTGAPFFPGGIPHIIFFQWGNLFGVAKYVVLPEEKSQKSNVLIYFEDMADRLINECIHDYNQTHHEKLKQQPALVSTPQQQAEPTRTGPKMGFNMSDQQKEDKK